MPWYSKTIVLRTRCSCPLTERGNSEYTRKEWDLSFIDIKKNLGEYLFRRVSPIA